VTEPLLTPAIGSAWPGTGALVTDTRAPVLNLSAALGQMNYTYRFALSDAVSGIELGDVQPIRTGSIRHDTGSTTKRTVDLQLGKADTAAINTATDRISIFMQIPGASNPDRSDGEWPLGRYQFVDDAQAQYTSGYLSNPQLSDEMFLVDQEIIKGISGVGQAIPIVIAMVITGLPITADIEPSPFTSADAWAIGARRGQILETLSVNGDYFSPWFDNLGRLRFIRTFDPATAVPDIDFDAGYRIIRESISRVNDLLSAPNTIIVISNGPANSTPVVGIATVPVNAPNSVANRGFAIPRSYDMQLSNIGQAQAVAQGLAQRQSIFETATLATPADPRHDGYTVIHWQGDNWLELAWNMPLRAGEPMTHTMRRAFR
jgi:hypothetical protein